MTAETATYTADTPPAGQCWCCGAREDPDLMVHLGNHPEVALCRPCARWAANRAREIDDRTKSGVLVRMRDLARQARQTVVNRGWHQNRLLGPPLRWIGKRLP